MNADQIIVGTLFQNPELHRKFNLKPEWILPSYREVVKWMLEETDRKPNLPFNISLYSGDKKVIAECISQNEPDAIEMVCDFVRDRYLREQYTRIIGEAAQRGNDPEADIQYLIDRLTALSEDGVETDNNHVSHYTQEVLDFIAERMENRDSGIVGVPSGVGRLDSHTKGWNPGDLVVLAGRPGMGKTTCALDFAMGCANHGMGVDVYSLEMDEKQLLTKMAVQKLGMNLNDVFKGMISDEEFIRVAEAMDEIKRMPIWIHTKKMRWTEIKASARRINAIYDTKMIVIDYLQLVVGDRSKKVREQQVSEISREVKLLAKELDVVVIELCQLSRAVESRGDKKPILSDLRESGSIEQDADMVIFPFRPSYYDMPDTHDGVEYIISKYRMGDCKTVYPDGWSPSFHEESFRL